MSSADSTKFKECCFANEIDMLFHGDIFACIIKYIKALDVTWLKCTLRFPNTRGSIAGLENTGDMSPRADSFGVESLLVVSRTHSTSAALVVSLRMAGVRLHLLQEMLFFKMAGFYLASDQSIIVSL